MVKKRKNNHAVIIISTFPDEDSAFSAAKKLVTRKLCACVSLTKIRSVYSWKGELEDQPEFMALFKTTKQSSKKLQLAIADLHPYQVPEIIELKLTEVSKSYLSWLIKESADGIAKKRNYAA